MFLFIHIYKIADHRIDYKVKKYRSSTNELNKYGKGHENIHICCVNYIYLVTKYNFKRCKLVYRVHVKCNVRKSRWYRCITFSNKGDSMCL